MEPQIFPLAKTILNKREVTQDSVLYVAFKVSLPAAKQQQIDLSSPNHGNRETYHGNRETYLVTNGVVAYGNFKVAFLFIFTSDDTCCMLLTVPG